MSGRIVPLTLVSGFVGAGKSTLLEHLKRTLGARRPVFLADSGDDDLETEIREAIDMQGADAIVIECACDLEPFFTAEALVLGAEGRPPLRSLRVDTLVTVVDAGSFLADVLSDRDVSEVMEGCDPEDDRTVAELLIEQVEFADVLIINKIDLANEDTIAKTEAVLERLNPRAHRLRCTQGRVAAGEVIGTGLFDLTETDDGAGWLAEMDGVFDDIEPAQGVSSFTFVERRPFHPTRFNELLGDFSVKGLIRAKGSVWVASRHHEIGVWSVAGHGSVLSYGGAWFAATPARDWPRDERERAEIMNEWVAPFGDRRQEIAFIGIGMNEQEIRERLDSCLLDSNEMKDGPDSWYSIPDPLPDWHAESEI